MIDLQAAAEAMAYLPEYQTEGMEPELSWPMLRETEDTLYVLYMVYFYGASEPTRVFLYDTKTKEASSLSIKEALERFGIKEYPAKPMEDIPCGDPGELDLYFDDAVEDGVLNRWVYRQYICTLVNYQAPSQGGYYWAFTE